MAVLDIVSLPLIEASLPLENSDTGPGRVWNTLHWQVSDCSGNLNVYWGRLASNEAIVVLLIAWKDRTSRDAFHNNGLGITIMNPYLERIVELQVVHDVDADKLAAVPGSTVLIYISKNKSGQNKSLLAVDGIQVMARPIYRVQVVDNGSNVLETIEEDAAMLILPDALDLPASEFGWLVGDAGADIKILRPRQATPWETENVSSPRAFLKLSDLFIRDPSPFGQRSSSDDSTELDIDGPLLSWRSPMGMFRYGDICFENRHAAPPPTVKYSHLYPPDSTDTHLESVSLVFIGAVPESDDNSSDAGIAFRAYRKLIITQEGCKALWNVVYADKKDRVDMIVSWQTEAHSEDFHRSPQIQAASEALSQHVHDEAQSVIPQETPFYPHRDVDWAEVVDFTISRNASKNERRAFEYYIWGLNATMDAIDGSSDQVVHPYHEGWLKDTHSKKGATAQNIAGASSKEQVYRVVYYWNSEKEELQWVKNFAQGNYMLLGYKAHLVGLVAESIRNRHVSIRRDQTRDFIKSSQEGHDEDLGF